VQKVFTNCYKISLIIQNDLRILQRNRQINFISNLRANEKKYHSYGLNTTKIFSQSKEFLLDFDKDISICAIIYTKKFENKKNRAGIGCDTFDTNRRIKSRSGQKKPPPKSLRSASSSN
jgi:hypothetical protein